LDGVGERVGKTERRAELCRNSIDTYTLIAAIVILALMSVFVLAIKDRIFSKPCPECRERVKSAAVKCRFCGHVFTA
jgi:Uncharacterised protein family UPF0547